jgi:hypothetical protein
MSVIARSSYDLAKQLSTNYGADEPSEGANGEGEVDEKGGTLEGSYAERILKG